MILGCTEFVAQMRKLLRGDQDQQTGLERASAEGLRMDGDCASGRQRMG
jgi:hypothetical protein